MQTVCLTAKVDVYKRQYLVAYNGWDDEFDTDNGFSGKVQYCLSIRDPRIADTSQSNGFESDNCGDASLIEPLSLIHI